MDYAYCNIALGVVLFALVLFSLTKWFFSKEAR